MVAWTALRAIHARRCTVRVHRRDNAPQCALFPENSEATVLHTAEQGLGNKRAAIYLARNTTKSKPDVGNFYKINDGEREKSVSSAHLHKSCL